MLVNTVLIVSRRESTSEGIVFPAREGMQIMGNFIPVHRACCITGILFHIFLFLKYWG